MVSPQGVIGKTGIIGSKLTEVTLLVNENCRITAKLEESRQQGILVGEGSVREGSPRTRLLFIPREASLVLGEKVFTSGLDGVFPPGLFLGIVSEIPEPPAGSLYREVVVTPSFDLSQLKNIFVVIGGRE